MATESDHNLISDLVTQMKNRFDSLTVEEENVKPDNRRRAPRRPHGAMLELAFPSANAIPADSKFVEVKSRDISTSGFSFWMIGAPPKSHCLVKFQLASDEVLFLARVAHATNDPEISNNSFVVGCSFSKRIDRTDTAVLF